jgi:hypothetical protein
MGWTVSTDDWRPLFCRRRRFAAVLPSICRRFAAELPQKGEKIENRFQLRLQAIYCMQLHSGQRMGGTVSDWRPPFGRRRRFAAVLPSICRRFAAELPQKEKKRENRFQLRLQMINCMRLHTGHGGITFITSNSPTKRPVKTSG